MLLKEHSGHECGNDESGDGSEEEVERAEEREQEAEIRLVH